MLYLLSLINLFKNTIVKLWSYKIVRFGAYAYLTYYLGWGFISKVMSRINSANLVFPGWEALINIPQISFNPTFIKSNKATASIPSAISMLTSIFVPGLIIVGIILLLQKALNTFKAPPLPIIYSGEDAEDIIVEDYRMPILYTKGESDYDDDDDEEEEED